MEGDYKGESKFASHMKTQAAASHFAKTRTLKEQREYLPAFACREDLMRTLRDNQGKGISADAFPKCIVNVAYESRRGCWRNRFREDDSIDSVLIRGWLLQ